MTPDLSPLTWIITEGIAGTENQCLGVAENLGLTPIIKRISLNQPWKTFSPYLGLESSASFTGDPLVPPWPDLIIASGRKSIAAVRYVKKMNPASFCVQIQDPRIHSKAFDLIAVPEHDLLRGKNVIVTTSSPNRVTLAKLSAAREEFRLRFEHIPTPRVALLIGGNSASHKLTVSRTHEICSQAMKLIKSGHGLMVSTSRRTGEGPTRIIRTQLQAPTSYIWDGKNPNPYFGFLAWADYILVTSDSVSMMSDAASTGKPLYISKIEGGSPRLDRSLEILVERGIARIFHDTLTPYSYSPLEDAKKIAVEIRRRSGLFKQ